jgi:hypothetical protein
LDNPKASGLVEYPFDVLGCVEVFLDLDAPFGEGMQLVLLQARLVLGAREKGSGETTKRSAGRRSLAISRPNPRVAVIHRTFPF